MRSSTSGSSSTKFQLYLHLCIPAAAPNPFLEPGTSTDTITHSQGAADEHLGAAHNGVGLQLRFCITAVALPSGFLLPPTQIQTLTQALFTTPISKKLDFQAQAIFRPPPALRRVDESLGNRGAVAL